MSFYHFLLIAIPTHIVNAGSSDIINSAYNLFM